MILLLPSPDFSLSRAISSDFSTIFLTLPGLLHDLADQQHTGISCRLSGVIFGLRG